MMKPGKNVDIKEEIVEVHTAARSPSPKQVRIGTRKLSNGFAEADCNGEPSEASKTRNSWVNAENKESLDIELPIHDQIKQGILGFVEKEIKKTDSSKLQSFVFYSHDPNGLDEKHMKSLSRPSSGHKEKRSPSYRKKKRHSSKHRDRELQEFEIPGSSLSALERVDDYLKEYHRDEVVTLSGELEFENNDPENNNGSGKELKQKPRKTRRKIRDERQESHVRDVSPKVFKATPKGTKTDTKPARPTNLSAMLQSLESNAPYTEPYIDNPFSSPSPLTSPNEDRLNPFTSRRPDKIYLQGGGTFRTVSRDRILSDAQQNGNSDKYLRLGDLTPLDIALAVQRAWSAASYAFHGVLGGLSLMHLLLISYCDGLDLTHLSFHASVTMPYVATYFFLCVLCLLSVLDRLDTASLDLSHGVHPFFPPIVLVILYTACLLICMGARNYDELVSYHYPDQWNATSCNLTMPAIPEFYHTWTHFSIWRDVLSILGLIYFVITHPPDLVYSNLSKLLQFKNSLQSIG